MYPHNIDIVWRQALPGARDLHRGVVRSDLHWQYPQAITCMRYRKGNNR